jgi:hypothetical protein
MSYIVTFIFDEMKKKIIEMKINEILNEFMKDVFKFGSTVVIVTSVMEDEDKKKERS